MSLADDLLARLAAAAPDPARLDQIRAESVAAKPAPHEDVALLKATIANILESQTQILAVMAKLTGVAVEQRAEIDALRDRLTPLAQENGLLALRGNRVDAAFDALMSRVEGLHNAEAGWTKQIGALAGRLARIEDRYEPLTTPTNLHRPPSS